MRRTQAFGNWKRALFKPSPENHLNLASLCPFGDSHVMESSLRNASQTIQTSVAGTRFVRFPVAPIPLRQDRIGFIVFPATNQGEHSRD
jgi:hypothetical protein